MANKTMTGSDYARLIDAVTTLKSKGYFFITENALDSYTEKCICINRNWNQLCFDSEGNQIRDTYMTWNNPTMDSTEIFEVLEHFELRPYQEHEKSYIELRVAPY